MEFKKKFLTIIAGLGILTMSFPGVFLPKAEALVPAPLPVFETNPKLVGSSIVSAIATKGTFAQKLLEWAKSFALSALKRRILDVVVNQVVDWVQNGGEPRFITDWDRFFGDIAQGAVGDLAQQLGLGFLCSPFKLRVRVGLLPVERFGGPSRFSCTLDQIVGNVNNFYRDFRNGGWLAYEATLRPQNNYYGALYLAWDAKQNLIANRLFAEANKAVANKGFLSVKVCKDKNGAIVSDKDRLVIAATYAGLSLSGGTLGAAANTANQGIVCEDSTPGEFVGASLTKAVGVDFDFIVNAQQLGDYASAIVNALINRVIKEGVNGVRVATGGAKQPNVNTYYSRPENLPIEVSGAGNGYNRGLYSVARSGIEEQLRGAYQDRTDAQILMNENLKLQQELLATLNDLLACKQRTNSPSIDETKHKIRDIAAAIDSLNKKMSENKTAFEQTLTVLNDSRSLTDSQIAARIDYFIAAVSTANPDAAAGLKSEAKDQLDAARVSYDTDKASIQAELNICKSK